MNKIDTTSFGTVADAIDDPAVIDQRLQNLADLPNLEYERCREEEAKKLGLRVTALDEEVKKRRYSDVENSGPGTSLKFLDADPWPDEVVGAELLDHIVAAINLKVVLPNGAAEAIALWVVHTYCFELFMVTPRLAVLSPDKRCGKTTLMTVLAHLVAKALNTSNITSAAIFRVIDKAQPTLLIDEADTFFAASEDIRGILNSGHGKTMGGVVRLVGDDHDPRQFSAFSPVVIAKIKDLPSTLQDRSIVIRMRRKGKGENVEQLRLDRMSGFEMIRRKIARWVNDNGQRLKEIEPEIPGSLHDRAADNWRSLLSIAEVMGGHWPTKARNVAVKLAAGEEDNDSVGEALLSDIRDIFERSGVDRMPTQDLLNQLNQLDDRPWCEWRKGQFMTPVQLAGMLKPFSVSPNTIRLSEDYTPRGYKLSDFKDAFARYLHEKDATPPQPNEPAVYE